MKKCFTKKCLACLLVVLMLLMMLPTGSVAADFTESDSTAFMSVLGATIRYTDREGNTTGESSSGLRFAMQVNKTNSTYKSKVGDATYSARNSDVKFGMMIIPTDLLPASGILNNETPHAVEVVFDRIYSQSENTIIFTMSLLGVPLEDFDRDFTVRPFLKVKKNGAFQYTYSLEKLSRSYVTVGNYLREDNLENTALCARLDEIFQGCDQYLGENLRVLKFSLFADLHYKEGMYLSSVADLNAIMKRANDANVDLVMQMGDFSNDWKGSPELTNAYLNNAYGLPVYGIYGNHELESNNSMAYVTPLLTNDANVVWGTANGKIGDGSIGYYYFECNGFRIICTDTNYSYNPTTQVWEHNYTGSYGAPSGNTKAHSLGPVQLAWLENVLNDAADKKIPCIVMTHASMSSGWSPSSDSAAVREIFAEVNAKQQGTVLMAINGHLHKNHVAVSEGVLYLDMNTVRNGAWIEQSMHHYTNQKVDFVTYDSNGNPGITIKQPITSLSQAKNTWFFTDPLSAIVTVSNTGRITIEGMETTWLDGVAPVNPGNGVMPMVDSGTWELLLY